MSTDRGRLLTAVYAEVVRGVMPNWTDVSSDPEEAAEMVARFARALVTEILADIGDDDDDDDEDAEDAEDAE